MHVLETLLIMKTANEQSTRADTSRHEPKRILRSSTAPRLVVPFNKGTFQDSASALFNDLPAEIRSCTDTKTFNRQVKQHQFKKAKLRLEK